MQDLRLFSVDPRASLFNPLLAQQAEQKKQLQLQILNKAECHSLE